MNLEYTGTERIGASRDAVWRFITDPAQVAGCLPEVVETTVHDDRHFDAVVQVGVGPVRGKFKLKCELVPHQDRQRLDMKISGGGFGSAVDLTAGADLVAEAADTTVLNWDGRAVARGPVAAVGGRVLDAQAQKLIAQTFATVRERIAAAQG